VFWTEATTTVALPVTGTYTKWNSSFPPPMFAPEAVTVNAPPE
jgi:hypothetical protein